MPDISGETPPERAGWSFTGYFDAQTGGTMYYDSNLTGIKN